MDSLAMNHINSALSNYGQGAGLGTPKTAGTAANRTYASPSVQFGGAMIQDSHDHQDDFARINATNPFNAGSKVTFGGSSAGWVPFGGAQKPSNRLSLIA